MTDLTSASATPEQIAAARALVAQADAAEATAAKAKADAARAAVSQLVAGDAFKSALTEMEAALEQAPKVQELRSTSGATIGAADAIYSRRGIRRASTASWSRSAA